MPKLIIIDMTHIFTIAKISILSTPTLFAATISTKKLTAFTEESPIAAPDKPIRGINTNDIITFENRDRVLESNKTLVFLTANVNWTNMFCTMKIDSEISNMDRANEPDKYPGPTITFKIGPDRNAIDTPNGINKALRSLVDRLKLKFI